MIAEGIYNPLTGEMVLVQGAGTVYNEEKNSIALGKDTVASGQDQFVFGRKNIEDATKVEIVGGGSYKQELLSSEINAAFFQSLDEGSELKIKINNTYNSTFALRLVTHDFSEFASKITKRINSLGKEVQFTFTKSSGVGTVIACFESADVTPGFEENGTFANTYFILTSDLKLGTDQSTDSDANDYASPYVSMNLSTYTTMGGSVVEVKDVDVSTNIRTLDWNGNEKLVGGLEIGGSLKIGGTTITGTQLAALLALLEESSES